MARSANHMARFARRAALVCAPLTVLALAATVAEAQDTVTLKDGKTETGRVKSADYDGLALEQKGQSKTIERSQVANIAYKEPPQEYLSGRDAFDNGKWDEALAFFEAIKAEKRAPIRQEVFFFAAQAQLAKQAWDPAIAALDALRKEFPKSWYLMEIGEGYVLAYTAKKDYVGAQKALDTMATDTAAQGVSAGFSGAISVLKGRLLEDQNKISEAAASYSLAEKATGVTLIVQQQARLGQGRCLIAQKKGSDAAALFDKLTKEDAPNNVLAGAWNGLGDIWLEEAKTKADAEQAEKLLDAALAFMRSVVQYGPGPGENARELCRGLEGSVKAFKGLAAVEKNAEKKATYTLRANERQQQLQRDCRGG
jgi:hypothetical protein